MKRAACALVLAAATGWVQAQTPSSAPGASTEALGWLQRIYRATETLSYAGTFVYQQGNRSETSRILRNAGAAGGVEKLEVLDGTPREILRTRDEIRCYLPDSRTVKVDRRNDPGAFPAMLPEGVSALSANYDISLGRTQRIAGYESQAVVLTPRDDLRYGYTLWADKRTGMLLRAQTFNREQELVEQFSFVQLEIGAVPQERLRPPRVAGTWNVEQAGVVPADLAGSGWRLGPALPGFRKIVEVRRTMPGARPVGQIVLSDGMAAVSIFIEPIGNHAGRGQVGLSGMGAVNVYIREVADHLVTVVGEAPAASVQKIGDTVEYRPQ